MSNVETLTVEHQLLLDVVNYGQSFHVVIEGKKCRVRPDRVVTIGPGWFALAADGPCLKCDKDALDTGWECNECGFDNKPFYYPEGQSSVVSS